MGSEEQPAHRLATASAIDGCSAMPVASSFFGIAIAGNGIVPQTLAHAATFSRNNKIIYLFSGLRHIAPHESLPVSGALLG